VTWNLTGHARFDGRLEFVRRNYVRFTERDYDGPLFSGVLTWTPTPKTKVSFGAVRQVGPPDGCHDELRAGHRRLCCGRSGR
jgi:hypothetical protein